MPICALPLASAMHVALPVWRIFGFARFHVAVVGREPESGPESGSEIGSKIGPDIELEVWLELGLELGLEFGPEIGTAIGPEIGLESGNGVGKGVQVVFLEVIFQKGRLHVLVTHLHTENPFAAEQNQTAMLDWVLTDFLRPFNSPNPNAQLQI